MKNELERPPGSVADDYAEAVMTGNMIGLVIFIVATLLYWMCS